MTYYEQSDTMRQRPLKELSPDTKTDVNSIKMSGQDFYDLLSELPQSADMTLAKRKVEEAVMWAVKAVTA